MYFRSQHISILSRTQLDKLVCERLDYLGKPPTLGSRYPFHPEPLILNAHIVQKRLEQSISAAGMIVTLGIMAVAWMTASD
jgi:hypothetical protein